MSPAEWWVAILLTVVALVGQTLFFTHAGALWRDEVNSAEFAGMPSLSAIHQSLKYDSFPLAGTLTLRGWMSLCGGSDAGLRTYGLLVGILFLGSLWLSVRLLGGSAPLLALALVTLNPWVIRTVASVRPYGLGMVFIVLTVPAMWKWVALSSKRWLAMAAVLAILSVQTLYQNAFLIMAICIAAALASLRGREWKRIIGIGLVGGVAAASLLPYLPSIAKAREWNVLLVTRPSLMELIRHIPDMTGAGGAFQTWVWLAVLAASAVVAVRYWNVKRTQAPPPDLPFFSATLILLATIFFVAAVKATQLVTQPWYYGPLLAVVAPALDVTVRAAGTGKTPRIAVLATALLVSGVSGASIFRQIREPRTNIDAVAAYLGEHAAPEDEIVVYPFYLGISFQRYYKGSVGWTTIPPLREIRIHRYDLFKEAMTSPNPTAPVLAAMDRALQSGHRVWIVGGLQPPQMDRPPPSIAPAPHPVSGWYWIPYYTVWGQQAAYFLSSHAIQFDTVSDLGASRASPYESVNLLVVSGWKPAD